MQLARAELSEHRRQFSGWSPPAEMRAHATNLLKRLGYKDFEQPGVGLVREAWLAATLGALRGARVVRLVAKEEQRPDFELQFDDGKIETYESVEAVHPGRKRKCEYAKHVADGCPTTYAWPDEWATPDQAFSSIRTMAEKKAETAKKLAGHGRPYPEQTRLLLYLNLADFGAHTEEIESTFATAAEPARKWFSSVWVLWNNRLFPA